MAEVMAVAKNLRISPKKVRLIADSFKGKSAGDALETLRYMPKKGAVVLAKTLKSAIANAENNLKLDTKKLFIKEILINEGPTLKRYRPVSRGAAHPILKRTSQIKVVLEER